MLYLRVVKALERSRFHERNASSRPFRRQIRAAGGVRAKAQRPDRRAPHQSWHAGRDLVLADAPLPQGVSLRPAGDRDQPGVVVVHSEFHRAGEAAFRERGEVPLDLERGARRIPASHHHAESGGESRQSPSPKRDRGRLGHALRQSQHRRRHRGARRAKVATGCSLSRSIPNMPRRRRRPPTTKCSTR